MSLAVPNAPAGSRPGLGGGVRQVAVAGVAAGATGLGYAWGEARWFALRHATVPVLPPGAPELRVLHLSDLHLAPYQRRKREWLAGLRTLEPDLVVNTGDNIGHRLAIEPV